MKKNQFYDFMTSENLNDKKYGLSFFSVFYISQKVSWLGWSIASQIALKCRITLRFKAYVYVV